MPGSMDERVVSMEFDNKRFEKNVKKSMKTIDDLKESLNFDESSESLDVLDQKFKKFSKKNVFADLDESCLSLRKGMGLLGNSAGSLFRQFAEVTKITAMIRAAESAIKSLERSIKQFTIAPIAQGFDKYTLKISSIKTIANATNLAAEEVDKSLERLNWFTDETSASFGEMVQNIGKFTSVGKGLDESITAMQGIATWGYQSGAGIAEMNRAMYNLSQALGTGSVKLIDWKSIENAGMATKEFKEQAIAAAEAVGTLKRKGDKLYTKSGNMEVNFSNFNSTLAKGWFSSDVLMNVLKTYGSFADEVKRYQEAHPQYGLASEAMEAMDEERLAKQADLYAQLGQAINGAEKETDDLGKSTKKTAKMSEQQIKQNVERINKITNPKERAKEIKKFASEVGMDVKKTTTMLDDLAKTEESIGEKAFKSSQQAKTFNEALDATKDAVSSGWMNTFQTIFGGLEESIKLWTDVTELLWDLFASGGENRNNALNHWAKSFGGREDLWGEDGIMHSIIDTIITLKELMSTSFQNVFFPGLEKALGGFITTSDRVRYAQNGISTPDQIEFFRKGEFYGYEIKKITAAIADFGKKFKEFFTNDSNLEKIGNIFQGIFSVAQLVGDVVSSIFGTITDIVEKTGIFQKILDVASDISIKVQEIVGRIRDSGFITKFFEKIGNTITWFFDLITGWYNQVKSFLEETGILKSIRDYFNGILEYFIGGENDVNEQGEKTESAFFRAFGWVGDVKKWLEGINLKTALTTVKLFVDNFGKIWSAFTTGLNGGTVDKSFLARQGASSDLIIMVGKFEEFGKKLHKVWKFIKDTVNSVVSWLESSGILPAVRTAWDGIETFFTNLDLIWEVITKGEVGDPDALNEKQKGLIDGILGFVKGLKSAWNKVKSWFNKAWAWVGEKWAQLTEWLESSGILPKIRSIWKRIKAVFGNLGKIWSAFTTGLSGGTVDKSFLARQGASSDLIIMVGKFEEFGKKIRGVLNTVAGAWESVKTWLETSGILPTLRDWWAKITEWFESVKKDIETNGVFKAVSDFFTDLWSRITGLFGSGGEGGEIKMPSLEMPEITGDGNGFFQRIAAAFTDENGNFNLLKGLSTGFAGLLKEIGKIDWKSISTSFFSVFVDVFNGFNDAIGKLKYDNIIHVLTDIAGAFSWVMILKTISDIASAFRSFVKKGNDKSGIEKFTDMISAIGQALLQVGISVALIAGSLWLLSTIKEEDMKKAIKIMAAIGALFLALVVVALVFSRNKGLSTNLKAMSAAFINLGIAVGIIVASIAILTALIAVKADVWKALGLLGIIMVAMVGVIWAMSAITKGNMVRISAGIAVFAGMAILVAAITGCILLLQGVDWGMALVDLLLLAGAMAGMIVAIKAMDKIKISPKTVAMMIILGVILALITTAFLLLKDANPVTLLAIGGAFAIAIVGLVKAVAEMDKIGSGSIKGAFFFAAALAAIAAGIAVAGVILSVGAKTVMDNFVNVMSSLAAASNSAGLVDKDKIETALGLLGEIVKALANVGIVDATKALAAAQAAWDVFVRLANATTSAELVDEKQFHKIFGEDGKSGLLQIIQTGLNSITNTGFKAATLGTHLEQLGASLQLLGESGLSLTKDLGEGKTYEQGIQNVKERLTDIQEIVRMATSMGSSGEGLAGKPVDLTTFAEGIANIGASLQLYNEALAVFENDGTNKTKYNLDGSDVAPVNTEGIRSALQTVLGSLTDVALDPKQKEEIEGWANLTKSSDGGTLFALGLTNIANAMGTFSTAAKDFDNSNVTNAVSSLSTLAGIKNSVEKPDQYKATIDGISTWGDSGNPESKGTFANAIVSMGNAMSAFGKAVKDIPSGAVTNATTALQTLAAIYNQLHGNEEIFSYFSIEALGAKFTFGKDTKSVEEVFTDFGSGIGKLASALGTFGKAIGAETYKEDKVKAATGILQDMASMQKALQEVDVKGDLFTKLIFGENDLGKLGDNMSGLGSRLATFQQELEGFDLDIEGSKWKNISGVLTFLSGIWQELNAMAYSSTTTDESGKVISSVSSTGATLEDLAKGIDKIREVMAKLSTSMNEVHNLEGGGTYYVGQWTASYMDNIKTLLTFFKDISIAFKTAGVKENDFYDLEDFGYDIQKFCDYLNQNDTFAKLTGNFTNMEGSETVAANFSHFANAVKTLSDATGVLHGAQVNEEDVKNMVGLFQSAIGISGQMLADEFITGFAFRVTQENTDNGASMTIGYAIEDLLSIIGGYSEDFFEQGKNAGVQYASGFSEGISEIKSFLSPVVSMDSSGKATGGSGSSLSSILTSMNYPKIEHANSIITNITAVKDKLDKTIKVDAGQKDVVSSLKTTNDRLNTIKDDVGKLRTEVRNLEVYISPKRLVGAIKSEIDTALGDMVNVSP